LLVIGATVEQVRAAAKKAGVRPYNVRNTRRGVSLRLRVLTRYRLRDSTAREACWHGHRRFLQELHAAYPHIRHVTVGARIIALESVGRLGPSIGAQCRAVFGGETECTCQGRKDPPPAPPPREESPSIADMLRTEMDLWTRYSRVNYAAIRPWAWDFNS
jgi:hypothetical protein